MASNIPVGSTVTIAGKEATCGVGILRFIGKTKFKDGIWAGVELKIEGNCFV